jgi:hypothetical protein
MKSLRVMALMGLGLIATVDAATVKVTNKSMYTVYVRPMYGNDTQPYVKLEIGEAKNYNSGLYKVYGMRWAQKLPASPLQVQDEVTFKIFDANIDIGVVNLGAEFDILNDGSYKRAFGVQGTSVESASKVKDL